MPLCYDESMSHVRGRVLRGRLIVDEPTELPDGDVELVVVRDEDAWPTELDAELVARAADVDAGRLHSLDEILALLRSGA
jgi:hypothetical protein